MATGESPSKRENHHIHKHGWKIEQAHARKRNWHDQASVKSKEVEQTLDFEKLSRMAIPSGKKTKKREKKIISQIYVNDEYATDQATLPRIEIALDTMLNYCKFMKMRKKN